MPEPDHRPLTEAELSRAIAIAFSALRARGELGARIKDGFAADKLARSLWLGGLRPYQSPGHVMQSPATGFPGRRDE